MLVMIPRVQRRETLAHGLLLVMVPSFEVLPGLPGEGPYPEQFTTMGGIHREGFVVRVIPDRASPWVGNFQPGYRGISRVLFHPDGRTLLVVSRGIAYPIDPESRSLASPVVDEDVEDTCVPDGRLVLVGSTDLTILGPGSQRIKTQRVAWDGVQDVRVEGRKLFANGWDAVGDVWRPIEVDLHDGTVTASAYGFYSAPHTLRSVWDALRHVGRRLLGRARL